MNCNVNILESIEFIKKMSNKDKNFKSFDNLSKKIIESKKLNETDKAIDINSFARAFKEIKIALIHDDIIEFGRRLCLQVENIFNYSLSALNIHNLILGSLVYYQNLQPFWAQRPFNFHQSFFDRNGHPVEISKVSFNTKSIFLTIHFNYRITVERLNELYFLRDIGSHRNQLTLQEIQDLENIKNSFDKYLVATTKLSIQF